MNSALRELFALEPVRVRAIAGAAIALALSLGFDLKGDMILTAIDSMLPIIGALLVFLTARGKVVPVAKLEGQG